MGTRRARLTARQILREAPLLHQRADLDLRDQNVPLEKRAPIRLTGSGLGGLARISLPRNRSESVYACLLWGPIAGLAITAKLQKANTLDPSAAISSVLIVCMVDVMVFAVGAAIAILCLRLRRSGLRNAATIGLHLALPLISMLLAIEHIYFRTTHTVADWYLLKEVLRELPYLTRLLQSQVTLSRALLLVSPWLLSAAIYVGYRLGVPVGETEERPNRARSFPGMFALGATLVMIVLSTSNTPAPLAPIRRNALASLAVDLVEDLHDKTSAAFITKLKAPVLGPIGPRRLLPIAGGHAQNALVIVLESVGARYTSLQGPHETTPFLKELALGGARAERAYAVVPHTSKSLVSILCGIFPKVEMGTHEATPGGIPAKCLPNLLREHGYATAFFQPAEEGYERRADLIREMGFERFSGKESLNGTGFDESSYFGWEDDAMLEPIAGWLDQQGDRPFFATVLTLASHHPYAVPRGFPIIQHVKERALNEYLNTVAYSDRFVRKLFTELDRRGLRDKTLVLILGDHGEGFGQHGAYQHDVVPYEEGIHIPLVITGPGVAAGAILGGLRQTIDVPPTIARAVGLEGDASFVGRDLLGGPPHERLFFSCYMRRRCVGLIEQELKTIHHFDRSSNQVFDLSRDPLEAIDLARKSGVALGPWISRSVRIMEEWLEKTNASYEGTIMDGLPIFVTRERPAFAEGSPEADFGDFARLAGYSVSPSVMHVGERASVTTHFEVVKDPPAGLELFLHFQGPMQVNGDHVPVNGTYPVSRWKRGDFIEDRYDWIPRPLVKAGTYRVLTGFWHPDRNERTEIRASPPLAAGPDRRLQIGTIEIRHPVIDPREVVEENPRLTASTDIRFGKWVRLASASIDKASIKAGLKVTPTFVFEVLRPPGSRFEFKVELTGPVTRLLGDSEALAAWPLWRWKRGQVIRNPHPLVTETRDPAGSYRIVMSLVDKASGRTVPVMHGALPIKDGRVEVASFEIVP